MRFALSAFGEFRRILTLLREADTLATTLDDSRRLGRIMMAGAYFSLGDYRRASDCYRENVTYLTGDAAREHFGTRSLPAAINRGWLVVPC